MARDDVRTKRRMNEEQALGYLLITCREMGFSLEQVKQIHSIMISQFNQCPPDDAKKQGEDWFHSIQDKTRCALSSENQKCKVKKPKYRRVNVEIPIVPESPHTKRIRQNNERIIAELQQMEDGPFGLFRLFRRCKK